MNTKKLLCEEPEEAILNTVNYIFNLIDANNDEFVSYTELEVYYTSFEISDKKEVMEIFDSVDTDYDGMITKEG